MEELNSLIKNIEFEDNSVNISVSKSVVSLIDKYGIEKVKYGLVIIIQEKWLETKVNSIINSMFEYSKCRKPLDFLLK